MRPSRAKATSGAGEEGVEEPSCSGCSTHLGPATALRPAWSGRRVAASVFAACATLAIAGPAVAVVDQGTAVAVVETASGGIGAVLQHIAAGNSVPGFIVAYALATVCFLPAAPLTIGAGAVFGSVKGTAIVSVSSMVGASLAFSISRWAARPYLLTRLASSKRFGAIDRAIGEQGAKIVGLLRLSPLIPFSLLNYMLGLTNVRFFPYLGASWLGMLPATFAYVNLGAAGRSAFDQATGGGFGSDPTHALMLAVGVAATLYVTKVVSGIASSALEETGAATSSDTSSDTSAAELAPDGAGPASDLLTKGGVVLSPAVDEQRSRP